jgi:LacI family transcriptional regulator
MLCDYQNDAKREKMLVNVLCEKRADGVVLFGGFDDERLLRLFRSNNIPVVIGDRRSPTREIAYIEFDNITVVVDLVSHLCKQGYDRIGFVSEGPHASNLADRFKGYELGLKKNGIAFREEFIYINDAFELNKLENGYRFAAELLKTKSIEDLPQVFVTTSDLLAIGIISAIKSEGYRVPDDFAVTGFDNLSITPYVSPSLTTISQDGNKMGRSTWKVLKKLLKDKHAEVRQSTLSQEIIFRNSCK